jgi:hypothetical protein
MMKSTKVERMAIAARLREALKHTKNSDIEATLNAIIDLDNIEAEFLRLHKICENIYFNECLDIRYRQQGKNIDVDKKRQDFVYAFNTLSEVFRNHPDVQRDRKETDDNVYSFSQGNAAVVRGKGVVTNSQQQSSGTLKKNLGVVKTYPPMATVQTYQKSGRTQRQYPVPDHCKQCGLVLLNGGDLCPQCALLTSPVFKNCNTCGSALTLSAKQPDICNTCHDALWNSHAACCVQCGGVLKPGRQLPDTCDWCSQSINAFGVPGIGKSPQQTKISQVIPSCKVCNCTLSPFDKLQDICNQCHSKTKPTPPPRKLCKNCSKPLRGANEAIGICFGCQAKTGTLPTGTIKDCSVCGALLTAANVRIGKCSGCQAMGVIKTCSDCKNQFTPDKSPTKCNHCVFIDNLSAHVQANATVSQSLADSLSQGANPSNFLNPPSSASAPTISSSAPEMNLSAPPKKISILSKGVKVIKKLGDIIVDATIDNN